MKVIFLNCCNGLLEDKLLNFIEANKESTDVFAFLEASHNINEKFKHTLNNFKHTESHEIISSEIQFDISVYVRNDIKSVSFKTNLINERSVGNCIFVETDDFNILVVHGTPVPGSKLDTAERLLFSSRLVEITTKNLKPTIIGGDFNLMPETNSIKAFSEAELCNLIERFNIKSTRNNVAWDLFKDEPGFVKQYHADYCFVSKSITVVNFEVPDIEISDHLPLILNFDI